MADGPVLERSADGFAERLTAAMAAAGEGEAPISDVLLSAELGTIGVEVTSSYLYMLRTGRRSNANSGLLMALARVLHVPVASLAFGPDDPQDSDRWNEALALCADPEAHAITKALTGLSPGSREAITALVTRLRDLEGLE